MYCVLLLADGKALTVQAVEEEVVPAAIQLCRDPVAVVRVAAADQLGQLLASAEPGARERAELLSKSLRVLSRDAQFHMRQVYIYMCYRLIGALSLSIPAKWSCF